VFVEASFSWGSPTVATETPFAFETGFRAAERRVSLVVRSDAHGVWQPLVVMTEQLGRFAERPPAVEIPALPQGCRGLRRTITPDLRVSTAEAIAWRRLEEVGEDRLTVRVPGGLAVSRHGASPLGCRGWASWSGRWRPRRCTGASGRTRRRGLPSSASTSLPPNNSESRLPHGAVQSHHETVAGTRSQVEQRACCRLRTLWLFLQQTCATRSPLALLAKSHVTSLTLYATSPGDGQCDLQRGELACACANRTWMAVDLPRLVTCSHEVRQSPRPSRSWRKKSSSSCMSCSG